MHLTLKVAIVKAVKMSISAVFLSKSNIKSLYQMLFCRFLFNENVRSSPNAASPLVDKISRRSSSDNLNATNHRASPQSIR